MRERAQFIVLRPLSGQRVSLRLPDPDEGFELVFSLQSEYPLLLDVLRQFGVCHIHYHHLLGHGDEVRRLPLRLGVGYDFTAHDFYLICPEITLTGPDGRYCGEDGPPGGSPAALAAWRQSHIAFANQARYLIGPSARSAPSRAPTCWKTWPPPPAKTARPSNSTLSATATAPCARARAPTSPSMAATKKPTCPRCSTGWRPTSSGSPPSGPKPTATP